MEWKAQLVQRLKKYKNNCQVIKQINSNKSRKFQMYHNILNVITIISSVFLTSIGFMDKKIISNYLYPAIENTAQQSPDLSKIDMLFNLAVLSVLILSIINLIYRFQEKSFEHYRAVTILSGLTRDIDDLIYYQNYTKEQADVLLAEIRNKYKSILDLLPQHTDSEFLKAKRDIIKKEKEADKIESDNK